MTNETQKQSPFEYVRQFDLSTEKGRKELVGAIRKSEIPHDFESKEGRNLESLLEIADKSFNWELENLEVTSDSLLRNYDKIQNLYGHFLIKRQFKNLDKVVTGGEVWDCRKLYEQADFTPNNQTLFACILRTAGNIASEALQYSPAPNFLEYLKEGIEGGKISEEKAKQHPNYPGCETLAIKADRVQAVWSDIFFKILSTYASTKDMPTSETRFDEQTTRSLFGRCQETHAFKEQYAEIHRTDGNRLLRDAEESVETFSLNSEADTQIRNHTRLINYWQPILEKYNATLTYENNTKSGNINETQTK